MSRLRLRELLVDVAALFRLQIPYNPPRIVAQTTNNEAYYESAPSTYQLITFA